MSQNVAIARVRSAPAAPLKRRTLTVWTDDVDDVEVTSPKVASIVAPAKPRRALGDLTNQPRSSSVRSEEEMACAQGWDEADIELIKHLEGTNGSWLDWNVRNFSHPNGILFSIELSVKK